MLTVTEKMTLDAHWSQVMPTRNFKCENPTSHNYSTHGFSVMVVVQGIFIVLKITFHFSVLRIYGGLSM